MPLIIERAQLIPGARRREVQVGGLIDRNFNSLEFGKENEIGVWVSNIWGPGGIWEPPGTLTAGGT